MIRIPTLVMTKEGVTSITLTHPWMATVPLVSVHAESSVWTVASLQMESKVIRAITSSAVVSHLGPTARTQVGRTTQP